MPFRKRSKPKRDKWHGDVAEWLHSLGFSERPVPTMPPRKDENDNYFQAEQEPGRCDILWSRNGFGGGIEVKTGKDNRFAFNEWRENQREWADKEARKHSGFDVWLAIFIGENRASQNPNKDIENGKSPRLFWLVPSRAFLLTEAYLNSLGSLSIPYNALHTKYVNVRQDNACALYLWKQFQLSYIGDREIDGQKKWYMSKGHPFWQLYLAPPRIQFWEETAHGLWWTNALPQHTA